MSTPSEFYNFFARSKYIPLKLANSLLLLAIAQLIRNDELLIQLISSLRPPCLSSWGKSLQIPKCGADSPTLRSESRTKPLKDPALHVLYSAQYPGISSILSSIANQIRHFAELKLA